MARLTHSFEVPGDRARIFAYVTTAANRPDYLPSVAAVRDAPDGPVQVGDGWSERARFGPIQKWLRVRTVAIEAPDTFAYEPDGGPGDGRVTWSLTEASGGRVRVAVELRIDLPWLARPFDGLVPLAMGRVFKADVAHLQRTLEALAPA